MPEWMIRQFFGQIERIKAAEELQLIEALSVGSGNMEKADHQRAMSEIRGRLGLSEGRPVMRKRLTKDQVEATMKWLGRAPDEGLADRFVRADRERMRKA